MSTDTDLRLRLGAMERRIEELEEKVKLLERRKEDKTFVGRRPSPYDTSRGKPL